MFQLIRPLDAAAWQWWKATYIRKVVCRSKINKFIHIYMCAYKFIFLTFFHILLAIISSTSQHQVKQQSQVNGFNESAGPTSFLIVAALTVEYIHYDRGIRFQN